MGIVRKSHRPIMILQCLLIVLPVLVLAGLGFQTLHKDRLLLEHEARQQAEALAAEGVDRFWTFLSLADSNQLIFQIGADAKLIQPSPYEAQPTPQSWTVADELTPAQAALWRAAEAAPAPEGWREFLASEPPGPWKERARYRWGLTLHERKDDTAARQAFQQVGENSPQVLSEAGVPLVPLARWKELEMISAQTDSKAQLQQAMVSCLDQALAHASIMTLPILTQASALAAEHQLTDLAETYKERWRRDERARALYHRAERSLAGRTATDWPSMFHLDGYLLIRQQREANRFAAFHAAPPPGESTNTDPLVARILPELEPRVPPHLQLSLAVIDPSATNATVASDPHPLATQVKGDTRATHLRATVFLINPSEFFARQRQRSFWFGGLVVLAALVAVSGYGLARHAFLRQLALNEMQANFISSVSHELRSPIAALRLMAEGLERGKVTQLARQKEYFRLMVHECRRLAGMVENVLTLARSDRQQQSYDCEPTDLPRLVRETVALIDPVAVDRGIVLETRLSPDCPTHLLLDGRAVQQALVNLIDNAINHSPPGETVVIGLETLADGVRLSVQDRGPGIPLEEQERIFERFYRRGSELRRETPGIGIGLSIVKQIVEDLGGRVWVESEPGNGSRFIVEFAGSDQGSGDRSQESGVRKQGPELRGQIEEGGHDGKVINHRG